MNKKILWIDDEIESLKSHILILQGQGYLVRGVSNGEEGCDFIKQETFDLVLLDEIMPGKDGLETLNDIKKINLNVPIIMITKSEDSTLVDKAYIRGVNDFLIKPLNPNQLIATCKRIFERDMLIQKGIPQEYSKFYSQVTQQVNQGLSWEKWAALHCELSRWSIKIGQNTEVKNLHTELIQECEVAFSRFVELNYIRWMRNESNPPMFSPQLMAEYVVPKVQEVPKVYLFIMDCMRVDQWFLIRPFLEDFFEVKENFYSSILPSATPFARNAIVSGLFTKDIAEKYPEWWEPESNKYESELLEAQMQRIGIKTQYVRVKNREDEENLHKNLTAHNDAKIVTVIVNFLDYLVHAKYESMVVDELIPDMEALRSLTVLWFARSHIYAALKNLSREKAIIILTTDHGALYAKKPSLIYGSKVISRNLRYKYGPALRCNPKEALFIENPADYKLPGNSRYGIAKEDHYFIYPTHPQEYTKEYKNTFQHGGISMQEMIIPCVTLTPKK
ncbi:MAG: response regulator [bacterium]|nr:response regulator [bacterium]